MTAARKRPPEGVTISWGWLGRSVAGVVVAGLPALVALVWRGVGDIRREIAAAGAEIASMRQELTVIQGGQASLLADVYDIRTWMQRHAEAEAEAQAALRERVAQQEARR